MAEKSVSLENEWTFGPDVQGLRISLGCLGVLGNCDSPLLSSPAGRVSDGFCSIDHLEISTSSGMSTRGPSAQTRPP